MGYFSDARCLLMKTGGCLQVEGGAMVALLEDVMNLLQVCNQVTEHTPGLQIDICSVVKEVSPGTVSV